LNINPTDELILTYAARSSAIIPAFVIAFLAVHEETTCQVWLDNVKDAKCASMKNTDYDVIRLLNWAYKEIKTNNKK